MPVQSNLHVDKLLSNISVRYKNEDYIADKVFPTVPVKQSTNVYRVYERDFRIPDSRRAPKAAANEHQFDQSTSSYSLELHALTEYVADRDKENEDLGTLRADTVEFLTDAMLRVKELHVASLFTSASWSLNLSLAAAAQWSSDTTTSNPIPQFDTAATLIVRNSGLKPNYGIVPFQAMLNAKNHSSITDRVKHTSREITPNMLAALFGLPELLIPTAQQNTALEGLSETMADIWPDSAFVGWKPARPSPRAPSSGYTFMKNVPMVSRWREESRASEGIKVEMEYQSKVVASLTGFLIINLLA